MAIQRKTKQLEGAWEAVLTEKLISDRLSKDGYVEISASNLKKITGLEPRILAKMDFSSQRPKSFVESGLNILPIENGNYCIGKFDVFRKFSYSKSDPIFVNSSINLESVSKETTSEGVVLRKAEISTMLDLFCGEQIVHTFSGRERSPEFNFKVKNYDQTLSRIQVDGVQIEVDGGFEGSENIYIFEVKNLVSTDFNIRQLYYPFRTYSAKSSKPIKCIYLVHSEGIYFFNEYRFNDIEDMSSIMLVKSENYCLKKPVVSLNKVIKNAGKDFWHPDYRVPFPQADSVDSLIEVVKFAGSKGVTDMQLKGEFDLTSRQLDIKGGYYPNAAKFLDLARIENIDGIPTLIQTSAFQDAIKNGENRMISLVIERITQIPGVVGVLSSWVRANSVPPLEQVVKELGVINDFRVLSGSTQTRRARTIRAWCIWIIQHTE